jgi:hypothetical protein
LGLASQKPNLIAQVGFVEDYDDCLVRLKPAG